MGRTRKTKEPAPSKRKPSKRGRGRPKKIVEKIGESVALTSNSSRALALVPVSTSRRHPNAEHTRIVHALHSPKEPEKIREPTAGYVLPAVDGLLYEGDKEEACPKCTGRLMWYWMPDEKEILSCVNPACDYPFDDTSELRTRTRDHGRRVIAGNPPEVDAEQANILNEMDLKVDEPGMKCYVPLETRAKFAREFVDDYIQRFMSTPKELRKPEVVDTDFIDYDCIGGTMDCLKALETAPIPD